MNFQGVLLFVIANTWCIQHCVHYMKSKKMWKETGREREMYFSMMDVKLMSFFLVDFSPLPSCPSLHSIWMYHKFKATKKVFFTVLRMMLSRVAFLFLPWPYHLAVMFLLIYQPVCHISLETVNVIRLHTHTHTHNELERNYRVSFMMSIPTPTKKQQTINIVRGTHAEQWNIELTEGDSVNKNMN